MVHKLRSLKYEFAVTSCTFAVTPFNEVTVSINVEGQVERYGRNLGTLNCGPPTRKNGAWHWCGVSYPLSGISVSSQGHGKFVKTSASVWQTEGTITMSDGHVGDIVGVFDLDGRTWSGTLRETN